MAWMNAGTVCGSILALMAGLSACTAPPAQPQAVQPGTVGSASGAPVTPSKLAGTAWTAFAIDGVPEVLSPKPKLRWDLSQRILGTGGCNAFGGTSVIAGDTLRLGPLTPMGKPCVALPGGQEDLFFKALERTRKGRLDGEQLVLLDAQGAVLARFLPGN